MVPAMTDGQGEDLQLARIHLESTGPAYQERIRAGRHELLADEPVALGGGDTGPAPYALLASALAACTAITLRMYADRKGWELGLVHVDVAAVRTGDTERFERTIRLAPVVTEEQRARLAEIADKCPVHRTLTSEIRIRTRLV
jgi:putative redox protein